MNIPKRIKKLIYYRQHPETALRYLPIVELIKKLKLTNSKILEVGSGSYGISPYLKKHIVGVDTSFDEPEYPLLRQVKASGAKIPFKSKKFDLVILSDVLEHIPVKFRTDTLNESIRVAKHFLIISGPFGEEAAEQDKRLAKHSFNRTGKMHPFFEEHLKLGLPEVEDVIKILKQNKRVLNIEIYDGFLNLGVREKLMKIYITNNKLVYYFYLKGLMPLVPILRLFNKKPTYRTLLCIKLK